MVDVARGWNENSEVLLSQQVKSIENQADLKIIKTQNKTIKSKYLIVCGGLQADRLAKSDDILLKERIVGFRGDYYELEDHAKNKVNNLISFPIFKYFDCVLPEKLNCSTNLEKSLFSRLTLASYKSLAIK